jgi:PIN domain nuclease of toxin-antitoxin system
MRFLLDTGVWLWSIGRVERLNPAAREVLADPQHELHFSAASAWEIAIKAAIGKLQFPESPRTLVPRETARLGLRPLPVNQVHALATYDLPLHHGDPFDRLLVAQARAEGLTLITADRHMRKYPVEILWAGR